MDKKHTSAEMREHLNHHIKNAGAGITGLLGVLRDGWDFERGADGSYTKEYKKVTLTDEGRAVIYDKIQASVRRIGLAIQDMNNDTITQIKSE